MSCPSCRHDNPAGARFCNACATPLAAARAPAERDSRDYTPRHLAEQVGPEAERARQLREARRLFAAMDATGHAERLGAELAS